MKLKALTKYLLILPSLMVAVAAAEANSPICGDPNQKAGEICYTEHKFPNSDQIGLGDVLGEILGSGSKTQSLVVDRASLNHVILDYQEFREKVIGNVSPLTAKIISSSGNAAILDLLQRETQRLTDAKAELQAKGGICSPSVCTSLQNQINSIDELIGRIAKYKSEVVASGGNEKISFSYTKSPAASADIRILLRQRYLGDASKITEQTTKLVDQSKILANSIAPVPTTSSILPSTNSVLPTTTSAIANSDLPTTTNNAALPTNSAPIPTNNSSFPTTTNSALPIFIENRCTQPLRILVRYQRPNGSWQITGFPRYNLPALKTTQLEQRSGRIATSMNGVFYYIAETSDRSASWIGKDNFAIEGYGTLPMKKVELQPVNGKYTISLRCS